MLHSPLFAWTISSYVETETGRNRVRQRERERGRKKQCKVGKAPKCTLEHLVLARERTYFPFPRPCLVRMLRLACWHWLRRPSWIVEKRREREREIKNARCNFSDCTSIRSPTACWLSSCLPAYCNRPRVLVGTELL